MRLVFTRVYRNRSSWNASLHIKNVTAAAGSVSTAAFFLSSSFFFLSFIFSLKRPDVICRSRPEYFCGAHNGATLTEKKKRCFTLSIVLFLASCPRFHDGASDKTPASKRRLLCVQRLGSCAFRNIYVSPLLFLTLMITIVFFRGQVHDFIDGKGNDRACSHECPTE